MSTSDFSRRRFVGTVTGAAAAWLTVPWSELLAAGADAARAAAAEPPAPFEVLTPVQAAALDAFAAEILPSDDSPGAREANAVRFVDRALATFAADMKKQVQDGAADLDRRARAAHSPATSFAALDSPSRITIMREMEAAKSDFFELARSMVLVGVFANPSYGGNAEKSGWQVIGFEDRFVWSPPFGYYDQDGHADG